MTTRRIFVRCGVCGLIRLCTVTEGQPTVCDECAETDDMERNITMPSIREMPPRELVRGLMRGDRRELKLGYSPANAVIAVTRLHPDVDQDEMRGYSQGYSDGLQRSESMVVADDPDVPENVAYRQGYVDGMAEPVSLIYPSSQAI